MSAFEIALQLIDFSPLEPLLAQHYHPSAKGQVPFHPVSMFLALLLRRDRGLSWRGLADLLGGKHGARWRELWGFRAQTPSASGLRYFLIAVGEEVFADLCQRFVAMLLEAGLCATHSTYPGDPPHRGVTIVQDGMLHPARQRACCHLATDACYSPLPPATTPGQSASAPPPRRCRAREKGHVGCACETAACQTCCQRASALDAEARLIHYAGHNKRGAGPDGEQERPPGGGVDVFGYRSIADRLLDDRLHVAWTLRSALHPANTDERSVFVGAFLQLRGRFADLAIGEWIDDAGVAYGECLEALWGAGVLRMVDVRADRTDDDPAAWLRRLYDAQGTPLCPHGYRMHSNGYDAQRRRRKWVCRQTCRREPQSEGQVAPAEAGCPYRDEAHPLGHVVNVGRTLPDGSTRLAREVPYGSPTWQARYSRRNHAESRNGQMEGLGLKRMCGYGLERNQKEVQLTDLLINLRTMGRLLQEASRLSAQEALREGDA